jgi:tetratricopeptide (TPR) repeat protein
VAELAPDSWLALKKRSDDLLRAEKWAESEAAARKILESGAFTFERAQPLVNVLGAIGSYDEMIELQAQVIALEPRAMFPSRDQQWNLYAAGRFEESAAEYQRSQTLDGSHADPDFVALLRGLARPDADP